MKKRVLERIKLLGLTQEKAADMIGMHSNTLATALKGKKINRNNLDRLIAFAAGARSVEPHLELSPFAAEIMERLARQMNVSTSIWCTGFAAWFDRQDRRFQDFVQDSVADAIRSMALPARTDAHPAKGKNGASGSKGPSHASSLM